MKQDLAPRVGTRGAGLETGPGAFGAASEAEVQPIFRPTGSLASGGNPHRESSITRENIDESEEARRQIGHRRPHGSLGTIQPS